MKTKQTITKILRNSLLVIFLGTLLAGRAHGQIIYETNYTPNTIGEYNATTGATINSSLVSGLSTPYGIAVSGGNLWVANGNANTIGEYNATTGATINSSLVSGLTAPFGIAAVPEPTTWAAGLLTTGTLLCSIWRRCAGRVSPPRG